jgi:outer membrane protein TolC
MIKTLLQALVILTIGSQASQTYSIKEYVDYLTRDHSTPKILTSKISVARYGYNMANALTDWTISTGIANTHVEPYQSSSFATSFIDTQRFEFSMSRPILTTGGSLTIGHTQQKISQPPVSFGGMTFGERLYFQNAISLTYSQPLLYGFMGETLKFPVVSASSNVQVSTFQSEEALEDFLLNQISMYIDWALAFELTELSFSRFQLAREAYNQTSDRVKVNLSEKIDLLRAESALERAHQTWLTQKAHLKSLQFKLSSKINDASLLLKSPQFELYETVYVKKPSYIVASRLRSMESLKLNKSILKKQLALSESKRNGNLYLIGQYDFLGGNTTFHNAQHYLKNNSTVALQYTRALSDTQSIEQIKKDREALQQIEYEETQLLIDLESEILALYTLIEEYKNILTTTLNQIIIAQQQTIAEEDLYKQGRSSLDMLIQSQDNFLNAKLAYANLSANYQKYVLSYQALTDELLMAYGVEL